MGGKDGFRGPQRGVCFGGCEVKIIILEEKRKKIWRTRQNNFTLYSL